MTQDSNATSFGTIDIHFDHQFNPSRRICIADAHGEIQKKHLDKLIKYFSILIIHINHIDVENEKILFDIILSS